MKRAPSRKNEVKKQVQSKENKELAKKLRSIGYPGLAKLIAPYNGKNTAKLSV